MTSSRQLVLVLIGLLGLFIRPGRGAVLRVGTA